MYIQVKVKTGQRVDRVEQVGENRLVVLVKEKPERNLANKKVVVLVAEHLSVPPEAVRIVSGHNQPTKLLTVKTDE